jgi:hypothetical protein
MNRSIAFAALALAAGAALAKLPPPSDEAKAKAAEAAAKTAHGNKVADYQLCKSMNATAAFYFASAKKAGKEAKPATATPDCADPGAFVYPPLSRVQRRSPRRPPRLPPSRRRHLRLRQRRRPRRPDATCGSAPRIDSCACCPCPSGLTCRASAAPRCR